MNSTNNKPYIKYLIAGFITFIFFMLNIMFLQRSLDQDCVVYINNAKWVMAKNKHFFNPHHLHFEISSIAFHKLMKKKFGKYGFKNIVFNLRLRSLLVASLGVFAMIIFLLKITKNYFFGISSALFTALTHGYLYNATKVDTGIFPMAWLCVTLWLFYELITKKEKYKFYLTSVFLAVSIFIGIMFHQYYVIVFISVIACFFIPHKLFKIKLFKKGFEISRNDTNSYLFNSSLLMRLKGFLIIVVIAGGLTGAAYFWTGVTYYRLPFKQGMRSKVQSLWMNLTFQKWLTAYKNMNTHEWGQGFKQFNPRYVFHGLIDSFLSQKKLNKYKKGKKFDYNLNEMFNLKYLPHNAMGIYIGVFLVLFAFLFISALKKFKYIFISVFLSFILFTILAVYWEPFYFEFWLTPVLLMNIIFIMLISVLTDKLKTVLGKFRFVPVYIVLFFLTYTTFLHNFKYHLIPHSFKLAVEGVSGLKKRSYRQYYVLPFYKHPKKPYKYFINKKR